MDEQGGGSAAVRAEAIRQDAAAAGGRETVTGSWTAAQCAAHIAVPGPESNKYSHGVLGVVTGSRLFPGAAVLGVEGAYRTGVGMVRYLGDPVPAGLVLQRRPETVTVPGRVQAWLIGSGADARQADPVTVRRWRTALSSGEAVVVDAGALDVVEPDGAEHPWVLTPHHRELARTLTRLQGDGAQITAAQVAADPAAWAARAARVTGAVVLLKGSQTVVASPAGALARVRTECGWLATAGTGDVLGGVLGALAATNPGAGAAGLWALAASAAFLHGRAARRASAGGPITALDVAEALPATVAALLAGGEGARAA